VPVLPIRDNRDFNPFRSGMHIPTLLFPDKQIAYGLSSQQCIGKYLLSVREHYGYRDVSPELSDKAFGSLSCKPLGRS